MDDNTLLTRPLIWHLISGLQYCSDKKTAIAWVPGGGSRGENDGGNSSFNMAADKASEWIQPTWTPQPRSPYLPILFFFPIFLLYPSTSPFELQISPCVSLQARWEIRSKVLSISAIWACCSFRFIYFLFLAFIYLSVTAWMYGFLFVYIWMREDFCL